MHRVSNSYLFFAYVKVQTQGSKTHEVPYTFPLIYNIQNLNYNKLSMIFSNRCVEYIHKYGFKWYIDVIPFCIPYQVCLTGEPFLGLCNYFHFNTTLLFREIILFHYHDPHFVESTWLREFKTWDNFPVSQSWCVA